MAILDRWLPADRLTGGIHGVGSVLLLGGILLIVLGLLGGSPEPLDQPFDDSGLIHVGVVYALLPGAALLLVSWALSRWGGSRWVLRR